MREFVQWTQALSVGVAQMDEEHQRLVGLLNRLYAAMREGKGREVLGPLFDGLVEYTSVHFAHEEKLMADNGYPRCEAHRAEHERITLKVLEYQQAFQAGRLGVAVDLFDFLKAWLVEHIQGEDREYGRYLNGLGIQ